MSTVFIVDDSPEDREWLSELATDAGASQVESFSAAEPMLRILEKESVEIVLLDYKLGGKSGHSFLPAIRSRSPDTIVVVVSSVARPEIEHLSRRFGTDYFSKDQLKVNDLRGLL